MRLRCVLLLAVLIAAPSAAQGGTRKSPTPRPQPRPERLTSITWLGYEGGLKVAKQQRKPMLVDFTASWCGWCKKLDAEVYSTTDVIALSRQFVCIKVDGDKRQDLVVRHRVEGYPTVAFLDARGREIARAVGYKPARAFRTDMETALSGAVGGPPPEPSAVRVLPAGLTVEGALVFLDTSDLLHLLSGRTEIMLPSRAPMLEAEVSPRVDEIAYGITPGPGWPNRVRIWKAALDGSNPVDLTAISGLGGTNCWPHWSPDGRMIAFEHAESAPGKRLCESFLPWVMHADGTGARPLTVPTGQLRGQARWLPDQKHLLAYHPDGSACIVSLDGTSLVPVPNVGAFATVSPDGTKISSSRRRPGEVAGRAGLWFELIITGVDGSNPVLVAPQFIPYAVLAHRQEGDAPFDGEPVGTLTQFPSAWSPSSDKVAFVAPLPFNPEGVGAREQMDVWVYDLRTSQLWRITDNDIRDWSISWHRWSGLAEAVGGPAGGTEARPFSARTGYLSRAGYVRAAIFRAGRTWLSRADAAKVVAVQQAAQTPR